MDRPIGGVAEAGVASQRCLSSPRRRSRYVSKSSLVRKWRIRLGGRMKDHIKWRNSYGNLWNGWKVGVGEDIATLSDVALLRLGELVRRRGDRGNEKIVIS